MRVTVDDAIIDASSEGSGSAIVMLHGFPLTREIWNVQAQRIAAAHRVVCLDLRGMGASSVPEGPYLMQTLAGDVAAVLDALGEERATIVGHSLGGYVAMEFCRMYAERVTGLVLVCSRLRADDAQTARAREALADALEAADSIQPVIEAYLPRLFAPQNAGRAELIERVRRMACATTPRGAAAMLRGMAQRAGSLDIVEDLTMPVSVVAGGSDAVVPLEESREMAGAFQNGRLVVMERSGHLPMLEEPDAFARALEGARLAPDR